MNCYYHPDRPAVAQCKRCGRGYCHEEADLFKDGVCLDCQRTEENKIQQESRQRLEEERQKLQDIISKDKEWHKRTVKYGLFAAAGMIVSFILYLLKIKSEFLLSIFGSLVFFVVYIRYGWRAFSILMKTIPKMLPEGWGCLISLPSMFIIFAIVSSITGVLFPFLYIYSIYVGYIKKP